MKENTVSSAFYTSSYRQAPYPLTGFGQVRSIDRIWVDINAVIGFYSARFFSEDQRNKSRGKIAGREQTVFKNTEDAIGAKRTKTERINLTMVDSCKENVGGSRGCPGNERSKRQSYRIATVSL